MGGQAGRADTALCTNPPKVPAEQRDTKLPQLPPLVHEAWLRVTQQVVDFTSPPLLLLCHHAGGPRPAEPPTMPVYSWGRGWGEPPAASVRAQGLPTAAPPGPAALPAASLDFALSRKIKPFVPRPSDLDFPCPRSAQG